jgi:hypothetical protein
MPVVPTGVHHTVDFGSEGEARLLSDGQGIDVGPQCDRGPGFDAGDVGHDAVSADATAMVDAEVIEAPGDSRRSVRLPARQFRMSV